MKRVLQIVDSMDAGGIQAFLMNLYRNIDRNKIQFDFLVFKNSKQWYEDEIIELGGKVIKAPGRKNGIIRCNKYLNNFFKNNNEYEIVHYNVSSLSFISPLYYAKKYKVEKRIIHSHSSSFIGSNIHRILHVMHKGLIGNLANIYLSCSEPATNWMYGGTSIIDKVELIKNGIDSKKFEFSEENRQKYRDKYGIENYYVIGQVGRFSEVKNYQFTIKVLSEILKINSQVKLLFIGDGELKSSIENLVIKNKLEDFVLFLGNRADVPELMHAMDVLVMPSLYEGFPVTAVEAQAAGLPVIMSDRITKEVCINENVKMMDLEKGEKVWASEILKRKNRINSIDRIKDNGLDIKTTTEIMENIYENVGSY